MKTVLLFDTGIATLNVGDEIINESIRMNWKDLFLSNYIIKFPSHTPTFYLWQNLFVKKNKIYANADLKFLCGTNALYTDMLRPEPAWNIFLTNTSIAKNTVCLGVGIGVNSNKTTWYTKKLYNKVLSPNYIHSVRDEKTKKMLEELGFKAWNTGCPTLWGLTPEFCQTIPHKKSKNVIFTLTNYDTDKTNDLLMVSILKKNYEKLYFWPQSFDDLKYLETLTELANIEILAPNLTSYEEILNENIDYVGNRLHGGIFAMQHKSRAIIISIDYRAKEMSESYGFKCIDRKRIEEDLEIAINSEWETKITGLDFEKIEAWKRQFD